MNQRLAIALRPLTAWGHVLEAGPEASRRMTTRISLAVIMAAALCATANGQERVPPASRVALIGVDGLGSRWIPWDEMPNLRTLRDEGLYSVGRAGFPTLSAPNWMSIFRGLPIELHGTRDNSGAPKATPWKPADAPAEWRAPCVFSEVRRQEPEAFTVSAFAWKGIGWCQNTNSVNAARHFGGTADQYADRDAAAVAWALSFLDKKPRLALYYQGQVDMAGHRFGWGSPEFTNACRNVDANIGHIVNAYRKSGLWDGTAIVVVADHGGHDKAHGDATMACFEIPFLIAGPAATGLKLREPIITADVAPTILALLGLDIPDFWRGRPANK